MDEISLAFMYILINLLFFQSCEKETSLDVIWKCLDLFVLLMFHRSGRKCIRNVKSKTR